VNKTALVLALILSSVGGALLFFYLRRFEREASGGEPVAVLMARTPIESGAQITDDMIATRNVPRAWVEDRAILESERNKVLGLRMGHTVQANQTLMWTDLAIAMDERRNLSSLVQPGMRAVTIRASYDDKSFALIRPGDRIDVIATMPQPDKPEGRSSVVLLQNVLVLAVGTELSSEIDVKNKDFNASGMVLSLSLNVQEAQLASLAAEKGKLSVALRNPDDVRVTEGMTDLDSSALVDTKVRTQVQGIRKSGPVRIQNTEAR
jgi:pilus assembly protein CpaB